MKRWHQYRVSHNGWWYGLVLGLAVLVVGVARLPVLADTISQGYTSNDDLAAGSLVSLDVGNQGAVIPTNSASAGRLVGVVVADDSTLLAVSNDNSNVQVATSGTADTLVSTVNGDIKKGDPITASPIAGVGMKATAAARIVGLAQGDFSAASDGAVEKEINSKTGKRKVSIGSIPVSVSVSSYAPKQASSIVPTSLQNLANGLAGRQVSTARVIIATALLVLGILLVGIILNSAIGSSLESIGRNPLAKSAVNSGLLKVLLFSLVILLVMLASIYFVLKA